VEKVGAVSELFEAVEGHRPDVVLMDVAFQRERQDIIPALLERRPELSVLVMVDHDDDECALRAALTRPEPVRFSEEALDHLGECCLVTLRSQGRGCVPRGSDPERLLGAIRTVAGGEVAAGPWLDAVLPQTMTGGNGVGSTRRPISVRELEVMELVADGKGNKEIAKELGIREQTVKNHLGNVMQKLGLKSRLEVALFAVKLHLNGKLPSGNGDGRKI
jgi:DNA-binding NarL/FixJ family response regulator